MAAEAAPADAVTLDYVLGGGLGAAAGAAGSAAELAGRLRSQGWGQLRAPQEFEAAAADGFAAARAFLDLPAERKAAAAIPAEASSASATGWHGPGGLSSFNAHREGLVFSDGALPVRLLQ